MPKRIYVRRSQEVWLISFVDCGQVVAFPTCQYRRNCNYCFASTTHSPGALWRGALGVPDDKRLVSRCAFRRLA